MSKARLVITAFVLEGRSQGDTSRHRRLIVRLRKELTDQGLDAGPATTCWHLTHHHQITISNRGWLGP